MLCLGKVCVDADKATREVFGQGDVDLVLIPGWASNVENLWTLREFAAFADKLAQFARVILLDRRGTGLSDPVADPPTLEERMDDVRAVIDAAGWERAVILGVWDGGPMAIMLPRPIRIACRRWFFMALSRVSAGRRIIRTGSRKR